jgi:hypothetical protein
MSHAREAAMNRAREKRQRRLAKRGGSPAERPSESVLAQVKQLATTATHALGAAVQAATVAVVGQGS